MPWVKVPPEHHPIFLAALPKDPRVETKLMFGGIAAKVNGHIFAGLFGRSTMLLLSEADRAAALALEGAAPFDPMGDGRARSEKVMLPEAMMDEPEELRGWIARAFSAAAALPKKAAKPAAPAKKVATGKAAPAKTPAVGKAAPAKKPAAGEAAPAKKPAAGKAATKTAPAKKAAASKAAKPSAPAKKPPAKRAAG